MSEHLILGAILSVLVCGSVVAGPKEAGGGAAKGEGGDPFLWLEEVLGEKALDWVKQRNAVTMKELGGTAPFEALRDKLQAIYDSDEKIPYVEKHGEWLYNFWKDAKNPKGLWRRTTMESYRTSQPQWQVLLDLDALGRSEGESWVWQGASLLREGGYRYALLSLSRGGADASVIREFDLETRTFVPGGFSLPEAKGDAGWVDKDTLFVSTDFGPGTMTTSGYPRIVKVWKRGTPLSEAILVYEALPEDMLVTAYHDDTPGFERDFVYRYRSFYSTEVFQRMPDGTLRKIEVPEDAEVGVWREWLMIRLRSDWALGGITWPGGSLLAANFDGYLAGKREVTALFTPTASTSLEGYTATRHYVILNVLEDVKNRLSVLTPAPGAWIPAALAGAPEFSTVGARAVDPDEGDEYWMDVAGFLTPPSLFHGVVGQKPALLKQSPAFFDASSLEVSQHFVASNDGTRIPYFQVSPKGMPLDGSTPTLLTGYGGFEISLLPQYSAGVGVAWLTRGGAYVVANIRGGGEYGPDWHQAALKANRMKAYEDFAAVAKDLVARKVTSVPKLGIQGGSNGGLLMGNMLTHFPELFGAIVCQVPLLDMKRYSKLLAGASWMAEYGDPDNPDEWKFLEGYSPYHNLKLGFAYPPVLFMTSTRDDRVHPGHARKMMARMEELGTQVRYYENIEGGHGGAADNRQRAHMWALAFTFLWEKLGKGVPANGTIQTP